MNEKEIELKKLEIEKLKIWADIFKTLVIVLLSIGAGIGTVIYKEYSSSFINKTFLVILLTTIYQWIKITRKLREFEKWIR